MLNPEVYLWSM